MSEWKMVGKIKEAHGLKGELFVLIFSQEMSWKKKLKKFYLGGPEGAMETLFSVQALREIKEGLLLKPEGVNDRTQAEKLVGKFFYIPADLLISVPGEAIFLGEILGFAVFDRKKKLGTIDDFSSNGPQDILLVKGEKNIWEIPFVEPFLKEINFANKSVHMELPEGLLQSQDPSAGKDDD